MPVAAGQQGLITGTYGIYMLDCKCDHSSEVICAAALLAAEACQPLQCNKGFSLDANGKHILAFRGSHSAAGNCAAARRHIRLCSKEAHWCRGRFEVRVRHHNSLKATSGTRMKNKYRHGHR